MKKKFLLLTICACLLLILSTNLSGQLSSRDSMILEKHKAVKLTDSLNSTVPKNIRIITMEFLIKKGLNPDEFYTIGQFRPHIGLARGYDKVGFLNILRINAFRDIEDRVGSKVGAAGGLNYGLQTITEEVGAAGGLNDDLQIVYDTEYKKVLTMFSSE
jgi:hypothetical protein